MAVACILIRNVVTKKYSFPLKNIKSYPNAGEFEFHSQHNTKRYRMTTHDEDLVASFAYTLYLSQIENYPSQEESATKWLS